MLRALAQEPPGPYSKLLGACEGLSNSFQCARAIEKSQITGRSAGHFKRRDGVLIIRTLAGGVSLSDHDQDNSDGYYYSYQKYLPDIRVHVLHVQLYEGSGFFVVHQKSGKTSPIDGFPIPSPDLQRFVAISNPGESGYYPNSVEIWNVKNGALQAEYRFEPAAARWSPTKAKWVDSTTVSFDGECGAELGGAHSCPTVVAKHRNGSWRLKWSLKKPE
jgi:hypothetical protein